MLGKTYFHDDLFLYTEFFRQFLRDQLAGGRFPLWNPYLFGGQPFFASPNAMAAYPLLYPTLLLPGVYGLSFYFFLHLVIAALGAHFLLKSFRLSDDACRIGAATFALSGFFWWEIIHPSILAAFSWMPWFIAFLERIIRQPKFSSAFGAGLAYALLFLSGNYQMSMTAFYGGMLYLLLRLFLEKEKTKFPWKKTWAPLTGAFLWGAFPLFLWLIPCAEFIGQSGRFHDLKDYAGFNAVLSLEPSKFFQFLFPQNPMGPVFLPSADFIDNMGYLGLWAPLLFFYAFLLRKKGWITFLILSLASFLLAWGIHLPFHRWACEWLPGFSQTRAPARILCLYSLSGAFFTALGFENLKNRWAASSRSRLFWPGLFYLLFLSVCILLKFKNQWIQVFCLGAGLIAIYGQSFTGRFSQWSLRVFQYSILLSLFVNAWTVISTGSASNFHFSAQAPLARSIQESIGPNRIWIDDNIPYPTWSDRQVYMAKFPRDSVLVLRIPSVTGYDPLSLRSLVQAQNLPPATFIRLMAVQGFLLGSGEKQSFGIPQWTSGPFRFERFGESLPLVWPSGRVETVTDETQRLKTMGQADFNPYQTTLLSEPLGIPIPPGNAPVSFRWSKTKEETDKEIFRLSLGRAELVVFSEIMYPGWKAWIDDSPAPLYTADHLLRSLVVPAGFHQIRFEYRPWWFWPLVLLGFFWLLSFIPFWIFWGSSGKSTKKYILS